MIYNHYGVMLVKVDNELILQKLFYETTPTIQRFFDPYSVSEQEHLT